MPAILYTVYIVASSLAYMVYRRADWRQKNRVLYRAPMSKKEEGHQTNLDCRSMRCAADKVMDPNCVSGLLIYHIEGAQPRSARVYLISKDCDVSFPTSYSLYVSLGSAPTPDQYSIRPSDSMSNQTLDIIQQQERL